MKKFYLLVTRLLLASVLFAADLTVIGGAGNYSFDKKAESSIGASDYKGHLLPMGRIATTGMISDFISYSAAVERDPILKTIVGGELGIEAGYLTISAGPLFGIFNSREAPLRPGFSAGIGLEFPGIIFFNLRGGAVLGAMQEKGDYTAETTSFSLGFWLPNLINTISVNSKKYSVYQTSALVTTDELLRFCYRFQVHAKPEPYTVAIDMGYQILSRSYSDTGEKDVLNSIFIGFETAITVKPLLTIVFGAEVPIAWGDNGSTMFIQGFAGFIWTLEKGKKAAPVLRPPETSDAPVVPSEESSLTP
jgi:hypothetical protein